jgi:hypothetical protein
VPTHQPLTNPLDALLLPRVLRWVAVVFRQKSKCGHLDADGRPWSRIPAKDLAAQLEREEGLEVSVRRIQRSLERLVEAGYLARNQRTKWWGQRDWWYSWADEEWALQQHRPTAVARSSSVTVQGVRKRRSEASVPTDQVLNTPLPNQTSLKAEQTGATSSLDRSGRSVTPHGASKGPAAPSPSVRSKNPLQALHHVAQRATAKGFGSTTPEIPSEEPSAIWVEGGLRYERLENGHVVVDSVSTAPLR